MSKVHVFTIAALMAVSRMANAQDFKVLYNFGSNSGDPTNPRYAGTISQSHGGYLLSTAGNESTDGAGSAFRITARGTLTVLHTFPGEIPRGGLTLATDGNFYGTTEYGGSHALGSIFKMSPQGEVTALYSFTGGTDGESPTSAPIQSMGGDLYGTTPGRYGGNNSSVYKITRSGQFTLLHAFTGSDGGLCYAPLVQGKDGYFYGTTYVGGTHEAGTIFRISAAGGFTVLFNFAGGQAGYPTAPLIQASDGNFYGVAAGGVESGIVFKMTPSHKVTVLHAFNTNTDGGDPRGGLVEASDGNFYGVASAGGASGAGTLFRITPAGTFTKLHDFEWNTGWSPQATLLQHTNGILYGHTVKGGTIGEGTFFSFDLGLPPFVSFLPVGGRVGARVQILGQGFTGATAVSFNGVPAAFNVSFSTYLTAVVPAGATTGYITVTTPSGNLKSKSVFRIWP